MPIAGAPQGVAALFDGAGLFLLRLALRATGAHQSRPDRGLAREDWTANQPHGRGNRQPVGEDHPMRRATRVGRRPEDQ